MKKLSSIVGVTLLAMTLLAGCSSTDTSDASNAEANKSTEKAKESAEKNVEDSIDNVMSFFKEQQVAVENVQPIEQMEFAAYEGKSFMVDGKNAYLYRVKTEDENMKKVMNEAKEKGKVNVSIDNEEMEYNAMVNNGYLLLYDPAGNMSALSGAFPDYVAQAPDTSNPSTTNPYDEKANSKTDTSNGTSSTTPNDPVTGNNQNSTNNNTSMAEKAE